MYMLRDKRKDTQSITTAHQSNKPGMGNGRKMCAKIMTSRSLKCVYSWVSVFEGLCAEN